ncbi:MAG: hypothetical protein PHI90_11200 [Clostridia bacterium]|nr:hypothetical protein [Clostridia bacterium]
MNWKFESLKEMKEFAKSLGEELKNSGLQELSNKVLEFKSNYYTTSSEYLGEFRIVLNEIILCSKDKLSNKWVESIIKGIEAINKAFLN